MRIQMLASKVVEKEGGARRVYQGGRFYLLPNKEARAMIADGAAVDPDAPPPEPEPTVDPAVVPAGDPERAELLEVTTLDDLSNGERKYLDPGAGTVSAAPAAEKGADA